ncbi:MAG: LysM peptidoglycan-binding domain-containing protein, partial [Tissierellia bacterium]|nr:LysM peptidoglycan-binding domain-containing protein [Tissierellia bacterium]
VLNDEDKNCDITSDIKISKCNAYRKNNNSVNASCEIKVTVRMKESDEVSVINTITEAGPIDYNKMPSLIFRVVQQGETIWDIAKNYNVSINYLKELNELSTDNLVPGSKIIIARRV